MSETTKNVYGKDVEMVKTRLEDLIVRLPDDTNNGKLDFKATFDKILEFHRGEGKELDMSNQLLSECQETYPSKMELSYSSETKYDNISPETRVWFAVGEYLNGHLGYSAAVKAPICSGCRNDIGCPYLCRECQWHAYESRQQDKREREEKEDEDDD